MYKYRRSAQVILNVCLILALLLSACGPSPIRPAATSEPASPPAESQPTSLPTMAPEHYDAPDVELPTDTSPVASEATPNLPPERTVEPVGFELTPSSAVVSLNGQVTLNVRVQNNTSQALADLLYTDALEAGLEYLPASSDSVSFDSDSQEVSYHIPSLAVGKEAAFSYTLQVTQFNSSDRNGELWLHSAQLKDRDALDLSAQAAFAVGADTQTEGTQIAAVEPDGGWTSLGAVSVYMQPDSIPQDAVLVASPVEESGPGPDTQFNLSVVNTGGIAEDSNGSPVEQRTAIGQDAVASFESPVFLEINLDGTANLDEIPAGQEPYVATYDEEYDVWAKCRSRRRITPPTA